MAVTAVASRTHAALSLPDRIRLRNGALRLHRAGARAAGAFLIESAAARDGIATMLDRLDHWRARLTRELLRAVGGDRFLPERQPLPDDFNLQSNGGRRR